MHTLPIRSALACAAAAALLFVLGFYSLLSAAPAGGKPPFEDAAAQREEMIRELRDIKELIREQNALLKESLAKPHDRTQVKK